MKWWHILENIFTIKSKNLLKRNGGWVWTEGEMIETTKDENERRKNKQNCEIIKRNKIIIYYKTIMRTKPHEKTLFLGEWNVFILVAKKK